MGIESKGDNGGPVLLHPDMDIPPGAEVR